MYFYLINIPNYYTIHPTNILPTPNNYTHYYNYNTLNTTLPPQIISKKLISNILNTHKIKYTYPNLFNISSKNYKTFTTITYNSKPKPQTPYKNFFISNINTFKILNLYFLKFIKFQ